MYKLHAKETQKCMRHAMIPKYILTFLPQTIYRYALGSTLLELKRWNQRSRLQWPGNSWWLVMYLHTKYGSATINNIGDLLWVHFFTTWLLRSRSQLLKTVSDIPWPNIYPQIEFGVNMSYNMRHALNTMICLLSVSFLVGDHTHDRYANSMLYK